MTEGIVFLVQEPVPVIRKGVPVILDTSSAQRYGKLFYVLEQTESPSITPGPCLNKMKRELKNFNPAWDYVCSAGGDPLGLSLMLLALRDMNISKVQLLRWEKERNTDGTRSRSGFYVPSTVPLY